MERRALIQWLVATAGIQQLESLELDDLLTLGRDVHRGAGSSRRALSQQADRLVDAATDQIIPATDTPGARAAGVTAFIDKMLSEWYTAEERERFMAGLPDLDARAQTRAAHNFVDCAAADQVAILTALDDEVTALRARDAAAANHHWFAMLKYLTVYGYCTSEPGMRALGLYPLPGRYEECATL
jgi:hypothetical protein